MKLHYTDYTEVLVLDQFEWHLLNRLDQKSGPEAIAC